MAAADAEPAALAVRVSVACSDAVAVADADPLADAVRDAAAARVAETVAEAAVLPRTLARPEAVAEDVAAPALLPVTGAIAAAVALDVAEPEAVAVMVAPVDVSIPQAMVSVATPSFVPAFGKSPRATPHRLFVRSDSQLMR
jgi:hypothetical protein